MLRIMLALCAVLLTGCGEVSLGRYNDRPDLRWVDGYEEAWAFGTRVSGHSLRRDQFRGCLHTRTMEERLFDQVGIRRSMVVCRQEYIRDGVIASLTYVLPERWWDEAGGATKAKFIFVSCYSRLQPLRSPLMVEERLYDRTKWRFDRTCDDLRRERARRR